MVHLCTLTLLTCGLKKKLFEEICDREICVRRVKWIIFAHLLILIRCARGSLQTPVEGK